jgi:hypothetical protein
MLQLVPREDKLKHVPRRGAALRYGYLVRIEMKR